MSEFAGDRERVGRVIAGEGLVEPVREVVLGGERLEPGRSRLSTDHPAVVDRPELFRPCVRDGSDALTSLRMRALYRAPPDSGTP